MYCGLVISTFQMLSYFMPKYVLMRCMIPERYMHMRTSHKSVILDYKGECMCITCGARAYALLRRWLL